MKPILIFFLFSYTTNTYCQEIDATDSIISWQKDYKLRFQDFRNPISSRIGYSAVSSICIKIEIEEIDTLITDIKVQCIFNRNRSFFQKRSNIPFF